MSQIYNYNQGEMIKQMARRKPKPNVEMSLYEANQSAMEQLPPLGSAALDTAKEQVINWVANNHPQTKYWMMLCHERRDYTIFHYTGEQPIYPHNLGAELIDCLKNRGAVIDIDTQETDKVEIWLKPKDAVHCHVYYLFPYDEGVIEV